MADGNNTTTASDTDALKGDFKPSGKVNGIPYFDCDSNTFYDCVQGKKKRKHWKTFIGGELGANIKDWASVNRNSNFMLRNTQDGSFIYAHRQF